MSFIPDTIIQQAIANRQKTSWGALASYWAQIVTDSNVQAFNTILSVLSRRGFQMSTIMAWDRSAEFNRRLATYYAMRDGGLVDDNDKFFQSLSKVESELSGIDDQGKPMSSGGVMILVNGQVVFPDNPAVSPIGQGDMERTDTVFEGGQKTNPERSQYEQGAANYGGFGGYPQE